MAQRNRITLNRLTAKKLFLVVLLLVVFGVAVYMIRKHNTARVSVVPAQTMHSLPTTSSTNPGKQLSSSPENQQTAQDNKGQATNAVSSSSDQWLQSESGVITVKQPLSGSTLVPGFNLYGTASVSKVQYRLIDDKLGVISQGFLNVVNGNFSGSVNFKSQASTGRLDVFSTDPNGREINEVQMLVKF